MSLKKKSYKANIKGIEWTFFVQTNATYVRSNGKDSEAITYPYNKEVYFNNTRLSPHVIRHELMHVYVASSGTSSANLTAEQMEELCAEIYEQHGPEMDLHVDKILEEFLK